MRGTKRAIVAAAVALVLAANVGVTAFAAAPAPVVRAALSAVTCNPGGVAGLRVTGTASVTNGTLKSAQLAVFEFQPISDPAFAPFTWTGSSVATWIGEGVKAGVTSDARTVDTTDQRTWNSGNYSKDIWFGSKSDSWWLANYYVSSSTRAGGAAVRVAWYVSCPTGRVVDVASLRTIEQVAMPRLP